MSITFQRKTWCLCLRVGDALFNFILLGVRVCFTVCAWSVLADIIDVLCAHAQVCVCVCVCIHACVCVA